VELTLLPVPDVAVVILAEPGLAVAPAAELESGPEPGPGDGVALLSVVAVTAAAVFGSGVELPVGVTQIVLLLERRIVV
jgi:hypothetical protein